MCVTARGLRSEDNLRELFLSQFPVGCGDGTQAARLTPKPPLPAAPSAQAQSSASFQSSVGTATLSAPVIWVGLTGQRCVCLPTASMVDLNIQIFTNGSRSWEHWLYLGLLKCLSTSITFCSQVQLYLMLYQMLWTYFCNTGNATCLYLLTLQAATW